MLPYDDNNMFQDSDDGAPPGDEKWISLTGGSVQPAVDAIFVFDDSDDGAPPGDELWLAWTRGGGGQLPVEHETASSAIDDDSSSCVQVTNQVMYRTCRPVHYEPTERLSKNPSEADTVVYDRFADSDDGAPPGDDQWLAWPGGGVGLRRVANVGPPPTTAVDRDGASCVGVPNLVIYRSFRLTHHDPMERLSKHSSGADDKVESTYGGGSTSVVGLNNALLSGSDLPGLDCEFPGCDRSAALTNIHCSMHHPADNSVTDSDVGGPPCDELWLPWTGGRDGQRSMANVTPPATGLDDDYESNQPNGADDQVDSTFGGSKGVVGLNDVKFDRCPSSTLAVTKCSERVEDDLWSNYPSRDSSSGNDAPVMEGSLQRNLATALDCSPLMWKAPPSSGQGSFSENNATVLNKIQLPSSCDVGCVHDSNSLTGGRCSSHEDSEEHLFLPETVNNNNELRNSRLNDGQWCNTNHRVNINDVDWHYDNLWLNTSLCARWGS